MNVKPLVELFPKDASVYIVQLEPQFIVSCTIPPHKRKMPVIDYSSDAQEYNCCSPCPIYKNLDAQIQEELQSNETLSPTAAKLKAVEQMSQTTEFCPGINSVHLLPSKSCKYNRTKSTRSEAKVEVPTTLWIHALSGYLSRKQFWQLAIREDEQQLLAKPYRLANVFEQGDICWGDNPKPKTLKQAFNLYWSSPANGDLTLDRQFSIKHTLEKYDVNNSGSWLDYTSTVFGTKRLVRKTHCDGVAVFTKDTVLEQIPEHYHTVLSSGVRVLVGWFNYSSYENTYYLNFRGLLARKKSLSNSGRIYPIGRADVLPV